MTGEQRAAALAEALASLGLRALLMGGHAVRFYGVDRSTIDYDFCLALDRVSWDVLPSLLRQSRIIADEVFREGPSWRPEAFRRFVVGALPDGREERLEFWREKPPPGTVRRPVRPADRRALRWPAHRHPRS